MNNKPQYADCCPGYHCLTCKSVDCKPRSDLPRITYEEQMMLYKAGMYKVWGQCPAFLTGRRFKNGRKKSV